MVEDGDSDKSPEIKEVLKALNHVKRRDILLYLKDLGRETSFSDLMDYLQIDSNTSSQFSYHLKLLLTARLIEKSMQTDKYIISQLGLKACSMLDMVDTSEHNESIVQKISNSYKNLSPLDEVINSFESLGILLFLMPLTGMVALPKYFIELFLLSFIGFLLFIVLTSYCYIKLQYIPSLLVMSNLVWVIFLPANQIKCAVIYMSSLFGVLFLYQSYINLLIHQGDQLIDFLLSSIFLLISILAAAHILYINYFKKSGLEVYLNT